MTKREVQAIAAKLPDDTAWNGIRRYVWIDLTRPQLDALRQVIDEWLAERRQG